MEHIIVSNIMDYFDTYNKKILRKFSVLGIKNHRSAAVRGGGGGGACAGCARPLDPLVV